MRPIEEIKNDPRLMFVRGRMDGRIKLSNGQEGTFVVGTNECGWEHISIHLFAKRLPTWDEMCEVKDIFWDEEEECVQIHPKKSEYVDIVDALHIWRPKDGDWSIMNWRMR